MGILDALKDLVTNGGAGPKHTRDTGNRLYESNDPRIKEGERFDRNIPHSDYNRGTGYYRPLGSKDPAYQGQSWDNRDKIRNVTKSLSEQINDANIAKNKARREAQKKK